MASTSLEQAIKDYTAELLANYTAQMPDDWQIKSSISFKVEKKSEFAYLISINLPEYWKYIEYGRRPGKQPPLGKIASWIEIKQIAPDTTRRVPDLQRLAFVIARKIGREGLPAHNYMQNAFDKTSLEGVAEAVLQNIKNELHKIMNNTAK